MIELNANVKSYSTCFVYLEIEENAEGYTLNDAKEHEAGYDAFLTGVGFLTMWKYLGM